MIMSFCDKINGKKHCSNTNCCGNSRAPGGCSETRIPSCNCQSNVGCLDRSDCGGLRPAGTAATGACPGACQCVEEEIWNSNAPPKPNCRWLSNFAELRRQWSDHGRQRTCKCCGRSRPYRTVAPCRQCLPVTLPCSGTILTASDCQKCCGSRRLAGGASKSEMASIDKSSSPERPSRREAGGGCPPLNCVYPSTSCNSPNANCSSTASSCCPSQCRYSQASSHQTSPTNCRSCCSSAFKSILKKRNCCQCDLSYCMCQPMPRGCNCPPPVQVDARAAPGCSCECPSSPECACPPSERRFPKTTVKCPNARLCCPFPRLPAGPKCHCARCRSCPPPSCDLRASTRCRRPVPPKNPCRSCPTCPPCRPVSPTSRCRPPTPCKKLTFCTERSGRLSSPCTGTGQFEIVDDENSESYVCSERNDVEGQEKRSTKDSDNTRDCRCAAGLENRTERSDQSCDPILDEEYLEKNSTSQRFINSSETANPSQFVDPDSHDAPVKENESAPENAAKTLEEYIAEKSSKDSRRTPPVPVPSDNRAKSNRYTFAENMHPSTKTSPGIPYSRDYRVARNHLLG